VALERRAISGLPPFENERRIAAFIEGPLRSAACEPTGITREFYLDLAEPLVRACVGNQRPDGSVWDPLTPPDGDDRTASPRFVAAIAPLVHAGRCRDLIEPAARAMDWSARRLAESSNRREDLRGPDFYTRDLVLGWLWLREHVAPSRAAEWARLLGAFDPEETYTQCARTAGTEGRHNWFIYSGVGEYLKARFGIADNRDFLERYLPDQVRRFDANGMYVESHGPVCYDLTVRQGLSWMLFHGYDGPWREVLAELLRRGGLMTLFFQSPTGQMPFGGRSNQYQHNEAMAAFILEYEARRYAAGGDPARAGIFKRAARRAALAVAPWIIESDPPRSLKNRFPLDKPYGHNMANLYTVYSLLAANLFGLAWHISDDSIEERPTPPELGGYVLATGAAFHRVFATAGGYGIEVDLAAEPTQDATGLGRVHRVGVPSWAGVSSPMAKSPKYVVPAGLERTVAAIGPAWLGQDGCWRSLAENEEADVGYEVTILQEKADRAEFRVVYPVCGGGGRVAETYSLSSGGVEVKSQVFVPGASRFRFIVPLPETDGQEMFRIAAAERELSAECAAGSFRATCHAPDDARAEILPLRTSNRNGIFRLGAFESASSGFRVRLQLARGDLE